MTANIKTPTNMKPFMLIWFGQLISIMGSGLSSFALGVWIYQQTGQATPFAITVLCGTLPQILLSPLGGTLADRWNRRWLMILPDTLNALLTLGVVILAANSMLTEWIIYLFAALGSCLAALQEPAYSAAIPTLVPRKDLTRANGLLQLSQSLQSLAAPLLAGVLFGLIGLQGVFLIDFITYFFAVGALFFVKIPQPEAAPSESHGLRQVLQDAAYGWNYLRAKTGLFILMFYFALVNFLLNFAAVLSSPLILSRETPAVAGVIQTVIGVGMLAGSVLISAWGGPKKRVPMLIAGIAIAGIGLILIGISPNPIIIGLGYFVMMFPIPIASGCSQTITQMKIEPAAQGRTQAIRLMVSRSIMPLAFLISGPLADLVFEPAMREGGALTASWVAELLGTGPGRGMGLMFVIAGLLLLVVTFFAALEPRIRNIETDLPDMLPESPASDDTPNAETSPAE